MIAENLARVRAAIVQEARRWGRLPEDITLIAVSKTRKVPDIVAALEAGQRHFGENRVQEAQAKFPSLRQDWPDLTLHLIGPLQTNKVKEAVAIADVIHTIDRPKLADSLAAEMKRQDRRPRLLVQVNIGEEPQKSGVPIAETAALLNHCRRIGLSIAGLMAIPPADKHPGAYFALLAKMADGYGLRELSMGMSGDYADAIALGATFVRVGSAIFGPRISSEQTA
ncbi:MAG TPA: YggS family pyridoxal phosphate-dependent enzyme [Dongiaceae bacterium]|jgi:hypothetical protein|nr:YggS family pyridoxal phosphate-dependent enzyme [Dongiaceae bacterium]